MKPTVYGTLVPDQSTTGSCGGASWSFAFMLPENPPTEFYLEATEVQRFHVVNTGDQFTK